MHRLFFRRRDEQKNYPFDLESLPDLGISFYITVMTSLTIKKDQVDQVEWQTSAIFSCATTKKKKKKYL